MTNLLEQAINTDNGDLAARSSRTRLCIADLASHRIVKGSFRGEAEMGREANPANSVENDRAAKLAAIPAGESPANRGVQSLL
jgi:hypothetical protein